MDRDNLWQRLRSLRAAPPGLASSGARKGVFGTALEQAEQLLRSAERLGVATKPINLFYGLSQAARSLAAAHIDDSRGWRLQGHGITHEGSLDRAVESVTIIDKSEPRGSFTSIARLLKSPSFPNPTSLADILAALPLNPRSASWSSRPGPLGLQHVAQGIDGAYFVSTNTVKCYAVGWPEAAELQDADVDRRRAWASAFLRSNYPTLADAQPLPPDGLAIRTTEVGLAVQIDLIAPERLGSDQARLAYMQEKGVKTGDDTYFACPAIGSNNQQQHPLLTWWAALWSCSMLARYEPLRWAKLLDVDKNSDATAFENLLDSALDLVPKYVLELMRNPEPHG